MKAAPPIPEVVKTVLVTRGPNAKGVTLDIIGAYPATIHPSVPRTMLADDARTDAGLVLDALLELPLETRREFAKLYSEVADLFVRADENRRPVVHPASHHVSRRGAERGSR